MNTVKRWEPSASLTVLFVQMQTFHTSDASGTAPFPVHTSCDALSLPCSLVSICPGKQNHGDLFQCLQRLPKKAQPFSLLYFSGGKVVTSPWWFSQSVQGLTVASPPHRWRLAQHGPAITHQQDWRLNYSLCISENRPPWRRFDLESTPLQSQVFQPWNRRRFLHSAEKVLTGRSLEEVCYLFSLQTETICGGGGSAWKRCFLCTRG